MFYYRKDSFLFRFIDLLLNFTLFFLLLRFVLKLFVARSTNGFVTFIYDSTNILLDPFRGIFTPAVIDRSSILEFSTLFAMLIYAVLAYFIIALIKIVAESNRE